ncbi:MAG: hypothetical protein IJK40_05640 [Clostridia bacterium]|nr:hypothetical protein [Clostridia bacterium]
MNLKTYRIGVFVLRLESEEPILDADFFPLFRIDDGVPPDFLVRVQRAKLPAPAGISLQCGGHHHRIRFGGENYDYTCFSDAQHRAHVPYACAVRQGREVLLYVQYDAPFWDTMVFDAIGLPDLFLEEGAGVFHAAFVGDGDGGILFAGPSGAGKTTQATLWQTHRNAALINGDRALILRSGDGFLAYGIPFCGSSKSCMNTVRPIRAIVFPEKGEKNVVAQLSAIAGFKELIGCISYTREDPAAQERAVLLTEDLAAGCRCFRLVCRPDTGAVEALSRALGTL